MLLLFQRAYVPIATLRRAVSYPDPPESKDIDQVTRVIKLVELGYLVDHLEDDEP
jgi:ABC-type uncharacterized transport system fused permease/ATPase subunit